MNRSTLLIVFIVVVIAGGIVWFERRGGAPPAGAAADAKASTEPEGPHVTRDASGRAVISMSDDQQGEMGIKVEKPKPLQFAPELKAFGRAQDPAALAAAVAELTTAETAYVASSNELARLKVLEGGGNASARALQTAEAASARDRIAAETARGKLALGWGKIIADQNDLSGFVQALTSREAALVRIDLSAADNLQGPPSGARISTLSGRSADAAYLGTAPAVDPQLQGQGFFFLIKPNGAQVSPGEALVGYLKVPGEPLQGVTVPRGAVVRTEGAAWVYTLKSDGEGFTRIEIPVEYPTEAGWFVNKGVTVDSYIVITGAAQLLSIEQKGKGE